MTRRWLAALLLLACPVGSRAAEPALEAAGLIVHVVDGKRQPVTGATVRAGMLHRQGGVEQAETGAPESEVWRETAGKDGTVRLAGLPASEMVWLLVERKGFFPEVRNLNLGARERKEMRVALRPGGVSVGRVVDEKGRPLAGAEVELAGDAFGLQAPDLPPFLRDLGRRTTRTGPAGRFRFHDLPEGEFELTLRHPSFSPLRVDRPVRGGRSGDLGRFMLHRGTAVHGTVTDPDGRPVAGLRLWAVTSLTQEKDGLPPSANTGPDGTFRISNLPPGPLDLVSCGPGYFQQSVTVHYPGEPVQLTVRPAATLRGRVLDPEGGPLAGVQLDAEQSGYVTSRGFTPWTPCPSDWTASTDAEGRFEIGPLWPGWYDLGAEAPGLQGRASMVRAPAGKPVEGIEIRLQRQPAKESGDPAPDEGDGLLPVWGRVVGPGGTPLGGAQISADTGTQTWSLADGSFELRLPPQEEEVTIQVSKPGFAVSETWVNSADPSAGEIEIRLEGGVTVTGRVLGLTAEERGRRIEVEIAAHPTVSSVLRPDATFRLDHVPTGFRLVRVHTWKRTSMTTRVLEPGTAEVSIDVEMPAAWPVAVQVLDELARPVSGARIEAWEEGNMVVHPGNTPADGRFTLLLPDGHYRIDFKKEGLLPVALELQVDGGPVEGLEARLPLTATLRGRLLGLAPGAPVAIQAQGPGPGSLQGAIELHRYSIEDLPPGLWTIEASTQYGPEEIRTVRLPVEIPSGGAVVEMDVDFADAEVEVEPEIEP